MPSRRSSPLDRKAKGLIGLILCSRVRDDVGHVTQVCVLPEYRSRGIGESLMAATRGQSAEAKLRPVLADRDGSQCASRGALSPPEFRYEEDLRCVRVGRVKSF